MAKPLPNMQHVCQFFLHENIWKRSTSSMTSITIVQVGFKRKITLAQLLE